jgi:hypothetical protein
MLSNVWLIYKRALIVANNGKLFASILNNKLKNILREKIGL